MKLVQIEALTREALNYAVALATDRPVVVLSGGSYGRPYSLKYAAHPNGARYSPSTNWAQGGPLLEEIGIGTLESDGDGDMTCCASFSSARVGYALGLTRLEAICRLAVYSKFPDGVEVPDELC